MEKSPPKEIDENPESLPEIASEHDQESYELDQIFDQLKTKTFIDDSGKESKFTATAVVNYLNAIEKDIVPPIDTSRLSSARRSWDKKDPADKVDKKKIRALKQAIIECFNISINKSHDEKREPVWESVKGRRVQKARRFAKYEITFKFEQVEECKEYYVYYYVNRYNEQAKALLIITNKKKVELKMFEQGNVDVNEGSVRYDPKLDSFNVYLSHPGEVKSEKSVPSFVCFDEAFEGIRIGMFSSSGTTKITSGVVVVRECSEDQIEQILEEEIPVDIAAIIRDTRQVLNRETTKDVLDQKQEIIKVAQSRQGIYEGYSLMTNRGKSFIQKNIFEFDPNGIVKYKTYLNRDTKEGKIVDVNVKGKNNMVLCFEHDPKLRSSKLIHQYSDIQMTLVSLPISTTSIKKGIENALIGTFGGIEENGTPLAGRIVLFRFNGDQGFDDIDVCAKELTEMLSYIVKHTNEEVRNRADILRQFIKGELDDFTDKPSILEQYPELIDYSVFKDAKETEQYEFSGEEDFFVAYYYDKRKHDVLSFSMTIDLKEEGNKKIEMQGLYSKKGKYIGLGTSDYQDETIFASLENEREDIINVGLYTGSNYSDLEIIMGMYQGVSPSSDSRIAGEMILVRKDGNQQLSMKNEREIKRYLFGETKEFLIKNVTNKLNELKINGKNIIEIAHLVGTYRALAKNKKGVFMQSKFTIEETYRSILISPVKRNQDKFEEEHCDIKINTFDGESRLFVLSRDASNYISGTIIEIPSQSKVKIFKYLDAAYFNFGYKHALPYASYVVFYKIKEGDLDFEPKELSDEDFQDNEQLCEQQERLESLIEGRRTRRD